MLRYDVLFSDDSPVRLDKVSFDGVEMDGGVKAIEAIPAGIPILAMASSMSSDLIPGKATAISVIQSHPSQSGLVGVRLMLGPVRFANHDCNPNCQVRGYTVLPCSTPDSKLGTATTYQGLKCVHIVHSARYRKRGPCHSSLQGC